MNGRRNAPSSHYLHGDKDKVEFTKVAARVLLVALYINTKQGASISLYGLPRFGWLRLSCMFKPTEVTG